MPRPEIIYTHARKRAIFKARFEWDWGYQEIETSAVKGELIPGDPFPAKWQRIGKLCREEEARRRGKYDSQLAEKPHRDAIEVLRRAVIGVADHLLTDLMNTKACEVDPKRLQEAIKAVTLAASIPAPNEEAPLAPGQQKDGKRPSGERVRTGTLLAAMRQETRNGESPTEAGLSESAGAAS
jgi:hypothetical protein